MDKKKKFDKTKYQKLYDKVFNTLKDYTPLTVDCGVLCNHACCKGDENTGMILFPFEETTLNEKTTENGDLLAVCNGSCDRSKRPLACRIFPFFPTIDDKGKIYVELDYRASRLCPMVEHCDELLFDPKFLKAIKKVGNILKKDDECRTFLERSTKEIDTYKEFFE